MIQILNIKQTVDILKEHGMQITENHLRAGIECGAYDFGVCIPFEKSHCFEVYKKKLIDWIEERNSDD